VFKFDLYAFLIDKILYFLLKITTFCPYLQLYFLLFIAFRHAYGDQSNL
jgi:hypothetical protein